MAIHLPTGPLKTRSGLEQVPRCEPSTYQIADDIANPPSRPVGVICIRGYLNTDGNKDMFESPRPNDLSTNPLAEIKHEICVAM